MHHMEVRYDCSKWPHIIWLSTTLLCKFKLALEIPLQCFFLQALRPLSSQTSLLYLQRSPAHLLMRPEHGLQAFGAWAHPSQCCQTSLYLLSHRLCVKQPGGKRHCGHCSQIPCDHESPGSKAQNLCCSCVFYALKFHIFPVPHESLGRVIDKQELFKGEQLKWSREWRNWFRKKD